MSKQEYKMKEFMEVKNSSSTGKIVPLGGKHKGKQYGRNSPDSTYISAGLYPLTYGAVPDYNPLTEKIIYSDMVHAQSVERIYQKEDLPSEEQEANTMEANKASMTLEINAIEVEYKVKSVLHKFSGSLEAQNNMNVAMTKLTGKSGNKKQNWFTTTGEKVKLNRANFEDLLDMIEPLMEAITDI